jgi:hypothetical protein
MAENSASAVHRLRTISDESCYPIKQDGMEIGRGDLPVDQFHAEPYFSRIFRTRIPPNAASLE